MKQKEANYFDMFVTSILYSCKAAALLEDLIADFTDVEKKVAAIHDVEHQADIEHHKLLDTLNKAFITPIDREDIMTMAFRIDDITDKIEDISYQFDMYRIKTIRPDMKELAKLISTACAEVKSALTELKNYKRSKTLGNLLISINTLEENGDRMYKAAVKNLFETCTDPRELVAWNDIYSTFEKCIDLCEDVADEISSILMKNN